MSVPMIGHSIQKSLALSESEVPITISVRSRSTRFTYFSILKTRLVVV